MIKSGIKLKMCREKCGYTQEEVAKLIKIGRNSLSRYENGEKSIPVTVFIKLAELYGCDVFDIMNVNDQSIRERFEFDADPYCLIKAHARFMISEEMQADAMFGSEYSNEYYDLRFRERVKDMLNNPIYTEGLGCMAGQEDIDTLRYFD